MSASTEKRMSKSVYAHLSTHAKTQDSRGTRRTTEREQQPQQQQEAVVRAASASPRVSTRVFPQTVSPAFGGTWLTTWGGVAPWLQLASILAPFCAPSCVPPSRVARRWGNMSVFQCSPEPFELLNISEGEHANTMKNSGFF